MKGIYGRQIVESSCKLFAGEDEDADEDQDSKKPTKFRMGFVLYDGDGNRIGDPWTFTPILN